MKFLLLSLVLLAVNAMAITPAAAKNKNAHHFVLVNNNKVTSKQQAANMVKKRYGGKVLGVQSVKGRAYRVKLLTNDGHVIYVTVDAKTGKISR
ncbi:MULTISPECIES: PepSY domain-containing protein [unclassified Thalassotalea]|uniref:PepSY domain-containing protein n=1 Tax=unclassified Thalassotalea TaxID=2614972 RepID=UPI0010805AF9|nr:MULTISPECIES: PepSY domain-containing protein [unclassified Thalassotalea]NMP17813.1 PepSY domain-containing protein [Thalassotalea sp. Y01]QBY04393.1 peptidase M4 [Thalassotalea sp. HSM 43]